MMQRHTFRHLDRDWEATVLEAPGDTLTVRFRRPPEADPKNADPATYDARVAREELDATDPAERELAFRRGLESALVLDALAGHENGLTAEEVARATRMPTEAAEDRIAVLDSVQPVLEGDEPRRYRRVQIGA